MESRRLTADGTSYLLVGDPNGIIETWCAYSQVAPGRNAVTARAGNMTPEDHLKASIEAVENDLAEMSETLSGCDWCCGGGHEKWTELQHELALLKGEKPSGSMLAQREAQMKELWLNRKEEAQERRADLLKKMDEHVKQTMERAVKDALEADNSRSQWETM